MPNTTLYTVRNVCEGMHGCISVDNVHTNVRQYTGVLTLSLCITSFARDGQPSWLQRVDLCSAHLYSEGTAVLLDNLHTVVHGCMQAHM